MVGSADRKDYRSTQRATPVLPPVLSKVVAAAAASAPPDSGSASGASAHLLNQGGSALADALRREMAQPLSEAAMLLSAGKSKKPKSYAAQLKEGVTRRVGKVASEVKRVADNFKDPADDLGPTSIADLSSWLKPENAYPIAKAWGDIQRHEPQTEGLLMVMQRLNRLTKAGDPGKAAIQALKSGGMEQVLAAMTNDPDLRQTCSQLCEHLMARSEKSVSSHEALLCYDQMQHAYQLKQAQTNAHQARREAQASLTTGSPADQRFAQNHYRQSLQALTALGVQAFRRHRLDTAVQAHAQMLSKMHCKADDARWQVRVELREKEGVKYFLDVPSSYLSSFGSQDVSVDFPKRAISVINADAVMATDEEVQSHLSTEWPALQEHLSSPACCAMFANADAADMVGELLRTQDLGTDRAAFSKHSLCELQTTNAQLRKRNEVLMRSNPMALTQEVGEWFHADERREVMGLWAAHETSPHAVDFSSLLFHLRHSAFAHEPEFRQQVQHLLTHAIAPDVLRQVFDAVSGLNETHLWFQNLCFFENNSDDSYVKSEDWQPSERACLQAFHQIALALSAADVRAGQHNQDPARLMGEALRQFRHAQLSQCVAQAQAQKSRFEQSRDTRDFGAAHSHVSALYRAEVQLNEALGLQLPACPATPEQALSPQYADMRDQVLHTDVDAFIDFASQWPPLVTALKQREPQAFEYPAHGQGSRKIWDAHVASTLIGQMSSPGNLS
jgi:hypothetical protein